MMLPDSVMETLRPLAQRMVPLMERFNQMSLRERGLIFGGSLVLTFMAWQILLMDPLAARAAVAQQKLAEAQQRAQAADAAGEAVTLNPALTALARDHAMRERQASLEKELFAASSGYVPPNRMADVLRQLLVGRHGLRLIALRNLPAEPLAAESKSAATGGAAAEKAAATTAADRGPYVHPVEIELEGDYASVVGYLRSLEKLSLHLRWRELTVTAQKYPINRVRVEIATLSLSRDWMHV
jgi:MSHA biogenesis protein MshJ